VPLPSGRWTSQRASDLERTMSIAEDDAMAMRSRGVMNFFKRFWYAEICVGTSANIWNFLFSCHNKIWEKFFWGLWNPGFGMKVQNVESQWIGMWRNVKFCKIIKCKNLFTFESVVEIADFGWIVENVDKMLESWFYSWNKVLNLWNLNKKGHFNLWKNPCFSQPLKVRKTVDKSKNLLFWRNFKRKILAIYPIFIKFVFQFRKVPLPMLCENTENQCILLNLKR